MEAVTWLSDHWMHLAAGKVVLDFVVKASPWKGDDVVLDVIWRSLKKLAGKEA